MALTAYGQTIVDARHPEVPFDSKPRGLTDGQLDDLQRQCAEVLVGIRREIDRRYGVKTSLSERGAPWERGDYAHWIDHRYKVRTPKGQWFVSEPYLMDGDDIVDLARLVNEGWDVLIGAERARWFPGATTAVELRRGER